MIVSTQTVIRAHDLDQLVTETYGRPYNLQQQDGCMGSCNIDVTVPCDYAELEDYERDTIPEVVNGSEMGVSFAAWLARDPAQRLPGRDGAHALGLFWERNFYPALSVLLNDLHARGLLPAGDHVIVVDW